MLKVAKREPSGLARCIALSNLGIFLCQELNNVNKHECIKEAIFTLLLALQVSEIPNSRMNCVFIATFVSIDQKREDFSSGL